MKLFKDVDNNQFFLTVWSIISLTIIVITISLCVYHTIKNSEIKNLVEQQYNLIELGCLYNRSDKTDAACFVLASKRAEMLMKLNK